MRKLLLPVLVLLVGIGLAISMFRGPIALRIMESGVERNMGGDAFADFPDGLHVVLCGAGGPLPDPQRSGPCTVVVAGETRFLVDAGAGAARSMAAQAIAPPSLDAIILTHFHSDHIDGLGEVATLRWAGGAHTRPLRVFGAEGVNSVVAGFNAAYRLDQIYRAAHHGPEITPPSGAGLIAEVFSEPAAGAEQVIYEEGDLRITAFRVDHAPIKPAVGYRFDYKGRSLVISGDTSKSESLEKAATGADLLIHEALSPELMGVIQRVAEKAGNQSMAKIAVDVLNYHATPREAAESAAAAGVKHLLYYHVVPATPIPGLDSVFLEGVSDAFDGSVTLGVDGTTISLPAGSQEVIVVRE